MRLSKRMRINLFSGAYRFLRRVEGNLIDDVNFRDKLRLATHDFIDLSGAQRILDAIIALQPRLNPAPQRR